MHRSGTSAVSGVLDILGVDFGKDMVPPSYDNPKGFFENQKVLDLNEDILSALGLSWDYPGLLKRDWQNSASIKKLYIKAQQLVKTQFGKSSLIAIKDPRMCHLFPFWEKCLEDLGISVSCLLTWREPSSVVKSLRRRNNLSENHSHILLASHFAAAEYSTRHSQRIFVKYENLIEDPKFVINDLQSQLELDPKSVKESGKRIEKFISRKLQHNAPTVDKEKSTFEIPHIQKLYNYFEKLSVSKTKTPSLLKQIDEQRIIHESLTSAFYNGIVGTKEYFCKIFIDSGKGFNEGETSSFAVNSKLHSWDISNLAKYGPILKIRVLPINAPSKLVLEYLGVDDDNEQQYTISSNAYHTEEKTYFFDNPHSEILINFDNPYVADKLILTIKYLEIGDAVFAAIKDLDYGRMLRAKDLDLESKASIISEREQHLSSKDKELQDLENIIRSYKNAVEEEKNEKLKLTQSLQQAIEAEKSDKGKVVSSLKRTIEAEKAELAKLKASFQKALEAEKVDKEKVKSNFEKAITAEKEEKQKLKENLLKAVNAEKLEAQKIRSEVTASMQKAIDAEKLDKQKLKESLQKAVEAEKVDKQKLKESLQKAIEAEKLDKQKIKESLQQAIAAEKQNYLSELAAEKEHMFNALAAEKEDKFSVKESMLKAIQAEKDDKAVVRAALMERLNAELENERKIRDERIGEATGLLYSEIKDKEEKINVLRETIQHEINEKNKVVNELKDERQRVVTELVSSVNHEIREKERAVVRLQQALQHEKAEQVRMFSELANSFSFKLGWFLTSPLRVTYNFLAGLKTGKVGMAFSMARLAMRNPATTLKNLNAEKLRTLQSALKRESPETITSNFDKFLNADKFKSAEITGQTAQAQLFESKNEDKGYKENIRKASIAAATAVSGVELSKSITDSKQVQNGTHSASHEHKEQCEYPIRSKKILFISPNIPDYDTSSGGKRATRMLGLLAEENEVYAYARGARQEKYITKLASLGVTFLEEYDYDLIKNQVPELDVIIYAWYYTYHESIRFKELYPNAKLIMDSVDIHWVREARSIGLMKGLTKNKAAENKKSEIAAYENGDVVWAVTEPDKQAVLKEIPDVDVRVVSNIHESALETFVPTDKNNILFFGGYNHYPNISAVKIIAQEILPQIRIDVPDAGLLIAGANAPKEVIELGKLEGVTYLGFIEEDDVTKLYESSKLTIAPLLAGAGIKGKICEAIAFMTPIITNAIGNEGIALIDGVEGFITEDVETMAQRAIECMQDKHDLARMTKKAQLKLHDIVGPEIVKKNMIDSLHREVSICIVTWNRLELLKPCIESILEKTNYPYYKVLVHSNGCEDGTQEYLRELGENDSRIVPILSDKNDVFVIPNNQMADRLPHNDVVLINNDVTVEENWLQALVDAAYSSRKIGISGSKILYPDGTLQEFGSELYGNGSGRNIGKWDKDPYKEEYSKVTAVGYVSGCSLFIKRETLRKTGLFDMEFHPCYCEDSDLCYSAWKKDIYTVVTPHSVINHFEGGTSGKDEDSGFKSYQKVNFDKFLAKHKKDLDAIANKISEVNKELHKQTPV